ncbi:Uncharacterised protein [Klebsiella oxytoca]|jgi:hypothetical protein|uniref:hypothetical protein n=1 Tax=Klebsiella oxytoca TaxID=571 RepID=UPI0007CC6EB0|nr:hypothetical protein [Klebsiella oxytoca]SAQ01501.1 Uncharacterised protein [Klebsiella oxytoca]
MQKFVSWMASFDPKAPVAMKVSCRSTSRISGRSQWRGAPLVTVRLDAVVGRHLVPSTRASM